MQMTLLEHVLSSLVRLHASMDQLNWRIGMTGRGKGYSCLWIPKAGDAVILEAVEVEVAVEAEVAMEDTADVPYPTMAAELMLLKQGNA